MLIVSDYVAQYCPGGLRLIDDVKPQKGVSWLHRHHPDNLGDSVILHDCEVVKWPSKVSGTGEGGGFLTHLDVEAGLWRTSEGVKVHGLDLLTDGEDRAVSESTHRKPASVTVYCGAQSPSPHDGVGKGKTRERSEDNRLRERIRVYLGHISPKYVMKRITANLADVGNLKSKWCTCEF